MDKLILMLKSRTFWTLVLMFAIGGVQSISPFLPGVDFTAIQAFLTLVATYFHLNPSQKY